MKSCSNRNTENCFRPSRPACPLRLRAAAGGGSSSSPAADTPGPSGGEAAPAAALAAAKTSVAAASSARTEAAVLAARNALSKAVETAEAAKSAAQADFDAAQAALTEAQDYSAAQAAILDGLQPVSDLAAVETASATKRFAAVVALDNAKSAMYRATSTRTEAAIRAARRALSEAVAKAEESLAAASASLGVAEADLTEAQNYRAAQTLILDSIPFVRPPGARPEQPSSPPGEFDITHVERSFIYRTHTAWGDPVSGFDNTCISNDQNDNCFSIITGFSRDDKDSKGGWYWDTELRPDISPAPVESYWRNVRDDARGLDNGFRRFAASKYKINGITIARKDFPAFNPSPSFNTITNGIEAPSTFGPDERFYDRYIVGIGSYSAFEILSEFYESPSRTRTFAGYKSAVPYYGGFSSAFGERSLRAPSHIYPARGSSPVRYLYRGAMAGVKHEEGGEAFTGTANLTYRALETGDDIKLELRQVSRPPVIRRGTTFDWSHTSNLSVGNDGSLSNDSNTIIGNFYGPNWDEAAGIVQTEKVYGAWLVHYPYKFEGDTLIGPVSRQNQPSGVFAETDFVQ